jgi:ATP dependent DNA ligase domain
MRHSLLFCGRGSAYYPQDDTNEKWIAQTLEQNGVPTLRLSGLIPASAELDGFHFSRSLMGLIEPCLPALASAVHCAFDLLELDGRDLRREPIERRKALLFTVLRGSQLSIVLNEHFEEDGAIVYREACRLGCEGIVSKRLGSPYRSGRSAHWVKVKNPQAPAVRREAEEDWRR